ncbi:MAG: response regulator [Candidatus Adiutrix sp.]|nr:response regulator [Candidatus Adiutrix sp.]
MSKKFNEQQLTWEHLKKAMAVGGLGLWQLLRDEEGLIYFEPGDSYLALTGLERRDIPPTAEAFLDKFLPRGEAGSVMAAILKAFDEELEEFSLEHALEISPERRIWLRTFADAGQRTEKGRLTGFLGFSQDISGERRARADLEAQMAEKTDLLTRLRRQIHDLIESSGRRDVLKTLGAEPDQADQTGLFTDYLNQALAFITSQMVWYKAVLDSLPLPVGVFDRQGRWAYLNQPAAEVHGGRPVREYLGRPNEAERDNFIDSDFVSSPYGESSTFTRYLHGSGRLFHGSNSVLRDEAGQDIGRIEILRDVTEIREADERTRIMLDAMPLACNFWDENFNNIDCNQAAAILFDLPDKQAYLDNFAKLSPDFQPNGRPSNELAQEKILQAFRDGRYVFEWLHRKLDGTPVPCEITLVRVARRDSYIVAGYTRDLRELKRTQAERDMERQLLRKIMDSTPICFTITVGGVIKFITPFARNFTGLREEDRITDIYPKDGAWEDLALELDRKSFVNWRPVKIRRADGEIRSMLLNAFRTDYYRETGVMSWLMDVTELKQRARELKEARDAAEESTRAKSEFLANMSHEIRTPMNAILGLIHLALQTEMNEVQREYLQKTESSAKTLLRIINDILDFSKIEAGKLEMEAEEFQLDEVLQQVVDQISTRAHEKGLELLLVVPPNTPAGLVGDQVRLAQVLSNLTSNAVKFTDQGQVTLKVATVREDQGSATLKFMVEDTGIGLTPEQTRNLFAAFSQAEASISRRYGGTGLGLAISKRLVEMMGGEIWCESQAGRGSVFAFTARFGLHHSERRYISQRKDFSGLAALAVDDNVVALEILSDFLRTLGFTVVTAASGHEALEKLSEREKQGQHFDLVFIDWKMPDMDGIETSDRIHQIVSPNKLPVIIMATAYNRDDVLDLARKSGIRNVLTKPLSPSTMLNVLVDIFGRGLPEKESRLKKAHEMSVVKEYAGARILLAEDNEVNQLVASRILKNAGLVVEIANNGRQALEMVQAEPYDLVLMDIQMPEMDGIEATHEIRRLPGFDKLPIVAMTAHAMSGDREMSLKAGMNDHINKPINLQELFSTLAKWLRKKPR